MKITKMTNKQHGFVLPVGMILMTILSVIAISSMRDSALQERMAGNFVDKEKSFQASESALRIVQRLNLGTSYQAIASTNSFHSTAEYPESAPDYNSVDWSTAGWEVSQVTDDHIAALPRAMIEEMQNTDSLKTGKGENNGELAKRYYRVTTFARGDTTTSNTTLQGVVVQE